MVAKSSKPNLLDGRDGVGRRPCHMTAKLGVLVNEDCHTLLTLKWLPKLHQTPYHINHVSLIV